MKDIPGAGTTGDGGAAMATIDRHLQAAESGGTVSGAWMNRCLFFGRVVDTLSEGPALRRHFARLLRVAAAGVGFAGLFGMIHILQFISRQQGSGILGGILYLVLFLAGIYMVVHAAILRAGHISSLPGGEFTLIPLCSVLSRLAGEACAAFSAAVSLGGGILIWCARGEAYGLLRDVSMFLPSAGGTDFLAGILFMVRGLVRALLAFLGGYLASELLLVAGRIGSHGPAERSGRG